jgi:phosphatidate cytidylyltransferase
MDNLIQRVLTGIVLVAVILGATIAGPFSFAALIILLNLLALLEFYSLFSLFTGFPRKWLGLLLSLCFMVSFILVLAGVIHWEMMLLNLPLAWAPFIVELFLRSATPIQNLAIILLGLLVITIPYCFFLYIALLPFGSGVFPYLALGYFVILWAIDSGAYFIGKTLGRHALFPRISPKKTWEGLGGGILFGLLAAFAIAQYFPILSLVKWASITLIIFITGTFGDFIKSMMKRSLGVKDSGTILPGHGGILDRFDTLLGSAPFVFAYLLLLDNY